MKIPKSECFIFRIGLHQGLSGLSGIFLASLVAQSLSLISTGYTQFFTRIWTAWNMVSFLMCFLLLWAVHKLHQHFFDVF